MQQGLSTSRYRVYLAGVLPGFVGVIASRWVVAQVIFGLLLWVSLASIAEQLRADRRGQLDPTPDSSHERWAELARWVGYACIGWFALVATPWTVGPWWVHAPLTIAALTALYAAVHAFLSHHAPSLSSPAHPEEARASESA